MRETLGEKQSNSEFAFGLSKLERQTDRDTASVSYLYSPHATDILTETSPDFHQ